MGPGARWWRRPSWRMWLSCSAGTQAGILTEPGVLSQWVERDRRWCDIPRAQRHELQLHVHSITWLKKLWAGNIKRIYSLTEVDSVFTQVEL